MVKNVNQMLKGLMQLFTHNITISTFKADPYDQYSFMKLNMQTILKKGIVLCPL